MPISQSPTDFSVRLVLEIENGPSKLIKTQNFDVSRQISSFSTPGEHNS